MSDHTMHEVVGDICKDVDVLDVAPSVEVVKRVESRNYFVKKTEGYPTLDNKRRPKTHLSDDEKRIIEDAYKESFLGARLLRHHIQKHYKRTISHNKIHQHLLVVGLARHNLKKQKKRKKCRYERKHSLSLVHADWHDYGGTQVIAYEDDTLRKKLTAGDFDSANIENDMRILGKAVNEVEFYGPIRALLSDNGSELSSHWKHKKKVQPAYFRSIGNNMG